MVAADEGEGETVAARESGEAVGVDARYLWCSGGRVRSAAPVCRKDASALEEAGDDEVDGREDADAGGEAEEDGASGVSFAGGPRTDLLLHRGSSGSGGFRVAAGA